MKKATLILLALATSGLGFAQNKDKGEKEDKRIETIKIIDGDTVYHDVRVMSGDHFEEKEMMRMKMRHEKHKMDENISEEIEELIEEMEVYIKVDDRKKEMMIQKMIREVDDLKEALEEFDEDEDILLDMKEGRQKIKVIKIEIDEEKGEEIEVIEFDEERVREMRREREEMHRDRGDMRRERSDRPEGLKIFPNPANEELNLEFIVREGKVAEVVVMDMDGEKVFSKTYKEGGEFKETVNLKGKKKGMYVVRLIDPNRTISKTIIVE